MTTLRNPNRNKLESWILINQILKAYNNNNNNKPSIKQKNLKKILEQD